MLATALAMVTVIFCSKHCTASHSVQPDFNILLVLSFRKEKQQVSGHNTHMCLLDNALEAPLANISHMASFRSSTPLLGWFPVDTIPTRHSACWLVIVLIADRVQFFQTKIKLYYHAVS